MGKFLAVCFILGGLLSVWAGFTSLTRETPQCGSSTMKSGDSCYEINRSTGHTTTRSAAEQRDTNDSTGWWLLGIGIPIAAFGVLIFVVDVRLKRGWVPPGGLPPGVARPRDY